MNLSPYIFKSWAKEAYPFRISFNLERYQEKTPPQIFLAFLVENGSVKCNQSPHFYPRLHKLISKVLPMCRYIVVATIYFSAKNFSQTISCFRHGFHSAKKLNYANALVTPNIFKYLPKSEEAVHPCSLKKLFRSISDNSQKSACAVVSFCVDYIFSLLHFKHTILLF